MNSLVLQRFARTSMLGVEVEARTDLADEPVFEAAALGILLGYKASYKCRELVRRLMNDGRLSWRSSHDGSTENSADNSMLVTNNDVPTSLVTRPIDVFVVVEHERVGTVVRDVEKLWLTERACLLVATASETERAWQVRTALVDFFLAHRRERTNASKLSPAIVHDIERARAETRSMLDEVRAIHADVAQKLDLDARVRRLEAQPTRRPSAPKIVAPPPTNALEASVHGGQRRMYRRAVDGEQLIIEMEEALATTGCKHISAREALAVNPKLAQFGSTSHALGTTLRDIRGVAFGGQRLVGRYDRKDITRWSVESVAEVTHTDRQTRSELEEGA